MNNRCVGNMEKICGECVGNVEDMWRICRKYVGDV